MVNQSFLLKIIRTATVVLGALVVLIGLQDVTHAAIKTFDGIGNLSTATNWDANTLPTDGDTIVFDATSVSNATWDSTFASSYSNLTVLVNTGYSGVITLGANATIASSTFVAGTFNIASQTLTANGPMNVNGGVVTSTFNAGTANFNSDVNVITGTLTPAAATTVKGHWTFLNAATLQFGSGAHLFTLTFASSTGSQNFAPGDDGGYMALTINNTAGGSIDSVVVVTNGLSTYSTLTITQGNLDLATNNLGLNASGAVVVANSAQAGLSLGTAASSFYGNIELGTSSTLSTASTTYTVGSQEGGTTFVTSTTGHVFNGTWLLDGSCGSVTKQTVSGGLGVTHLRVRSGIMDFATKNATLDADGTVLIDDIDIGSCPAGTHLALTWGTGQFNIGGHFTQEIANTAYTAGNNTIIFDGATEQMVSTTATFYDMHIRKTTGTVHPGTAAVGSTNVMTNLNVVDLTVATGTLDFTTFDDYAIITDDFLVTGASTSIKLPSGATGLHFYGDVLMSAAGSFTTGTATSTIISLTTGVTQNVGASVGTMSLGKLAVSSTMKLPEGYTLTVDRITATTSLSRVNLQGSSVLTNVGSLESYLFVTDSSSNFIIASTSTVTCTGTGWIQGLVFGNLTLNASSGNFSFTASTTIISTLTVGSATEATVAGSTDVTILGSIANSGSIVETGSIIYPHIYLRFVNSGGLQKTALTYQAGDLLYVEVKEVDANLIASSAQSMPAATNQIRVYSGNGDAESVLMTETGLSTNIFRGSILIRGVNTPVAGNGLLEMTGNGNLSVAYVDAQNTTDAATTTIAVVSGGASGIEVGSGAAASGFGGIIAINSGAGQTTSRAVTLNLSATGANEMAVSDNPDFIGGIWEPYASTRAFMLSAGAGTKKVYVKFSSPAGLVSPAISDSILYTPLASGSTSTPSPVPVTGDILPPTPAPGVQIPFGLSVGDLVKIDGNTAVYYIDASGTRRSFPMEAVYHSWYGKDFSKVKTITPEQLATFSLGKNMTIKPGTYLVKITTMPNVYVVTRDATLQWVSTEARAVELYGADWAKGIVDIPDAFFVNYTILSAQL